MKLVRANKFKSLVKGHISVVWYGQNPLGHTHPLSGIDIALQDIHLS